jgi:hypothetical protein
MVVLEGKPADEPLDKLGVPQPCAGTLLKRLSYEIDMAFDDMYEWF